MFSLLSKIFNRVDHYVRRREWPWRYRGIRYFLYDFYFNFGKTITLRRKFKNGNMSNVCYHTQIFGPVVLKETLLACKEANIHPFLVFGSLLGQHRDGGIIETDDDIDLGILEEDIRKIPELKREMEKQGYYTRVENNLEISFRKHKYYNSYIDFWFHYQDKRINKVCTGCILDDLDKVDVQKYPPHLFSKFRKVRFIGSKILIPDCTEEYLELTYGKYWRVPMSEQETKLPFADKQVLMHPSLDRMSRKDFDEKGFLSAACFQKAIS